YAKLSRGPDHFAEIVHALGLPAPHALAWVTTGLELGGGLALMAGGVVRPISPALSRGVFAPIIGGHWQYGFSSIRLVDVTGAGAHFGPVGYETPLLYIATLATLASCRASAWSVDDWLARRRRHVRATIEPHSGDRAELRVLFRIADDSEAAVAR